jgi:glutathione synthase/RimK-type ligase-like ATP-grasp enzyme
MIVGIHPRFPKQKDPEMDIYRLILEHNDIEVLELNINQPDFWYKIKSLDLFIFKWAHVDDNKQIAKAILPIIENSFKIKCFPNQSSCWHYDDKVRQFYLLQAAELPVVNSWVFYDRETALKSLKSIPFPLVFKLSSGAGSLNVKLIKDQKHAERLINLMFRKGITEGHWGLLHLLQVYQNNWYKTLKHIAKAIFKMPYPPTGTEKWQIHKNYVYFQEFLDHNQYDTRVTTAGNRAHAFRRFVRNGDFRASGSNNWDINVNHIDMRMVELALSISKRFNFQSMAYDFLLDSNNEPKIVEMSYLYGGAGFPDFMNGYWDENLFWHEGRFWPQYFELVDLLGLQNLKMPKIEMNTPYSKANIH